MALQPAPKPGTLLPGHINRGWYEADVVEQLVEDGYFTVKLNADTLVYHRRNPLYWLYFVRAILSMTAEAVVRVLRRLAGSLRP